MSGLDGDVVDICVKTSEYHSTWLEERQFRITGSDSYQLFTYRNNKKPDWCQKSKKYFYPESLSNAYTQHGLKNEPLARNLYDESESSITVAECGLVISQKNPWLAYSPDGVVFDKNNNPIKLIEIKCPYEGKKQGLEDVLQLLKWLVIENGNWTLKKKHTYYAQVQIGMAVLNLPATDFIMYTPFDNKLAIFTVNFDELYAKELLYSLKGIYFNNLIHYICIAQTSNDLDNHN